MLYTLYVPEDEETPLFGDDGSAADDGIGGSSGGARRGSTADGLGVGFDTEVSHASAAAAVR